MFAVLLCRLMSVEYFLSRIGIYIASCDVMVKTGRVVKPGRILELREGSPNIVSYMYLLYEDIINEYS